MNIIFFIHLVLFIATLVIPFLKNTQLLEMYSMLIPFIFYQWSVNDDTCALTQMEMFMTGKHKDETFMGRLVGPIYKMEDNEVNKLTKTLFFALWAFVQYRLGHFKEFTKDLNQTLKVMKLR